MSVKMFKNTSLALLQQRAKFNQLENKNYIESDAIIMLTLDILSSKVQTNVYKSISKIMLNNNIKVNLIHVIIITPDVCL